MPAILKGYIERVFVAGFAYDNTVRGLKGRLGDTVRIITTHNTPKIFSFYARLHQSFKISNPKKLVALN